MIDGARSSRRYGLPFALAMVLALLASHVGPAQAQSGCGGFQGFNTFGGNFQQGGGFNFSGGGFQGGFQGGFNFGGGGLNFNGALTGFGFNFGGRPGCGTGVFGLIPDAGTVGPGQPFSYRLVWVTPGNWHDLEYLDLRIRDSDAVLLVRWYEATNSFAIIDPLTGQTLDSGPARSSRTLRTPTADVRLSGTYSEDSGPTGQAVGLNIELILAPAADGRRFSVDVAAKEDAATAEGYEYAAILTVSARNDPNNGDEKDRKLTEEQHQQRERTNRGNLDDYRTEGTAVSSACDDPIPNVTIANRDGNVVLQLSHDAKLACGSVRPGDYIEATGDKQHEQLYDVDQMTVRRNGSRVR